MAAPAELVNQGAVAIGEHRLPADSILLDPRVQIQGIRQEGSRAGMIDAMVPIELIAPDPVPVSADRVAKMKNRLLTAHSRAGGGTGILDSLLLCEIPGKNCLDIADGYHRFGAILGLNADLHSGYEEDSVFCSIRPNCTELDLLNLRIDSTSEHANVSFARASLWILNYWRTTPWSQHLTVAQAFGMAASRAKTVGYTGLTHKAASEIKTWANASSERWGLKPATIGNALAVASISAPDLAISVRPRDGGNRLSALTADHMSSIARAFPFDRDITAPSNFEDNWDIQRLVASYVIEHNIPANKTRALLDLMAPQSCRSLDAAKTKLARINLDDLIVNHPKTGRPQATREAAGLAIENRALREARIVDTAALALSGLDAAIPRFRYIVPRIVTADAPLFSINVSDSGAFDGLLVEQDHADLSDRLHNRQARIANLAAANLGISDIDEFGDFDVAIARVLQSAQNGTLRYIDLSTSFYLDSLLYKAVADEFRLRNRSNGTDNGYAEDVLERQIVEIRLERLVGALSLLDDQSRMLVVQHGIVGMEPIEIASIEKTSIKKARLALKAALTELN